MLAEQQQENIAISNIIAPHFYGLHKEIKQGLYNEYWLKGGRGSTKSTFVSIQILLGMIADPNANAIALRRYQNELRDTVYGQFEWTANKLGIRHKLNFMVSPMQIVFRSTGQKIVFRAADNPRKLKSINLGRGYTKYGWFEEVDQFPNVEEIRNIIQSLFRGEEIHERVSFYSYNPPKSGRSWVNQEVKLTKPNRRVHHSDYTSVPPEWLGQTFLTEALHLKNTNEIAYRHEYLGEEVGTGLEVFTNLEIRKISPEELDSFDKLRQGLDFGFATDPNCFVRLYYDKTRRRIYLLKEVAGLGMHNRNLWNKVKPYNDILTIADSAAPKDISELKMFGMRIKGAKKGKGSVEHGIKFLQGMDKIIIDPDRCPLSAKEFTNYALEQGAGGLIKSQFPDNDNHCLTGDTIINTLRGDYQIKDLVGTDGVIHCYDTELNKATIGKYYDVKKTGRNKIYEVALEDGRTIKATDYHPVLTDKGYKLIKELKKGDKVIDVEDSLY